MALYEDCELVASGFSAMLEKHRTRVRVVDLDRTSARRVDVDVILLDPFTGTNRTIHPRTLADLREAPVLLYTWRQPSEIRDLTAVPGVAGYLPKSAPAGEVVATLEAVRRRAATGPTGPSGPTDGVELTAREGEVLGLIARGLSNQAIGAALFLSANTIKSYIRTAYRKIGVRTRAQAVAWVLRRDQ